MRVPAKIGLANAPAVPASDSTVPFHKDDLRQLCFRYSLKSNQAYHLGEVHQSSTSRRWRTGNSAMAGATREPEVLCIS
jgi:hypothetical protein